MTFEPEILRRLALLAEQHRLRDLRLSEGVSFCDNDYLGLSDHPSVLEAGREQLAVGPAGSRGSRLLGGHSRVYEAVEARIARHFGAPAALFFSSGYLANLAAVTVAASLCDHVVSDAKNHASLIDGIRLAGKPKTVLPHQRWDAFDRAGKGRLLLVAESLYGMDGVTIDAERFRARWDGTDSFALLDEAHAAGVMAEEGLGLSHGWRDWGRMAVTVTFGKAFGVGGAAVLCSEPFHRLLVNAARPFLFTTAAPPVVPAMVARALEVAADEAWRREELWERAETVRRILRRANDERARPIAEPSGRWDERSPVVAFAVPGPDNALRFSQSMRHSGIEVRAIRYPTVPEGEERIRLSLSLGVSRENTERMAEEMVERWMAFSSPE